MQAFFLLVGLWPIGWGILLASLLLRGELPTAPSDPNPSSRGHRGHRDRRLTLLDTTEIEL